MQQETKLVVGASLESGWLPEFVNWLVEGQRDLEIKDPLIPGFLDEDWQSVARDARTLLADHGFAGRLGIHGPFHDLTIMARDPRARRLTIDRLQEGLDFAAEVGATHMVIHSPFWSYGLPAALYRPGVELEECIALVHRTLDPLLGFTQQIGCMLVIETMVNEYSPTPLLALIRSFNSESVRLSLDTGHALLSHRYGAPAPHEWVLQAGPLLTHLHLDDNDADRDYHWSPGDGAVNWYALFAALREIDTQPRIILETPRMGIERGAAWLTRAGYMR